MDDFRVLLLDEQGKIRAVSDRGMNCVEAGQLARWIEHGGHLANSPAVLKFYTPQLHSAPLVAGIPSGARDVITFAHQSHESEVGVPDGNGQREVQPVKRPWLRSVLAAIAWAVFGK